MIKTIAYVGNLEVKQSDGNFLDNLEELKGNIITPRDEAYVRLQTRNSKDIGRKYGTWTSAGLESVKKELPILRLKSRLLEPSLARQAFEANRDARYFSTDSISEYGNSLEQAKEDKNKEPSERSVIVLPSRDNLRIDKNNNWDVLESLLKDQAKPYFQLNGPMTFYLVDKDIVDSQNGILLTQLWFWGLDDRSIFDSDGRSFEYDNGARGVFEKTHEVGSQKFSKQRTNVCYTENEVNNYMPIVKGVRTGELPTSQLENLV